MSAPEQIERRWTIYVCPPKGTEDGIWSSDETGPWRTIAACRGLDDPEPVEVVPAVLLQAERERREEAERKVGNRQQCFEIERERRKREAKIAHATFERMRATVEREAKRAEQAEQKLEAERERIVAALRRKAAATPIPSSPRAERKADGLEQAANFIAALNPSDTQQGENGG